MQNIFEGKRMGRDFCCARREHTHTHIYIIIYICILFRVLHCGFSLIVIDRYYPELEEYLKILGDVDVVREANRNKTARASIG